jgi:hypothetical protein
MAGFVGKVRASLSEHFASAWRLLSDTTNFLSRTSAFPQYEAQLAALRLRLASSGKDDATVRAIRAELTDMRKALRLAGYDLTLGSLDLEIKGFRNDASLSQGFRRMVLFIGRRALYVLSGEENHRALHDILDRECARQRVGDILQKHYLWYRWNNGLLSVSGADSETASDFENLKIWAEIPENRLMVLGRLRNLK